MESNHRRARLQRAALPLSYPGNSGADGGNRTRITGVALQGPANRPRPHFEMVGNRGIEPRTRKGAGFTGPLSHQTWRYPELVAGLRVERTFEPHPEGATIFKTAGRPSGLDSPIWPPR